MVDFLDTPPTKESFLSRIPRRLLLAFLILVCLIGIAFMGGVLYLINDERITHKLERELSQQFNANIRLINSKVQILPVLNITAQRAIIDNSSLPFVDYIESDAITISAPVKNILFSNKQEFFHNITINNLGITTKANQKIWIDTIQITQSEGIKIFEAKFSVNNNVYVLTGKSELLSSDLILANLDNTKLLQMTGKENKLNLTINSPNFNDFINAITGAGLGPLNLQANVEIVKRPADLEWQIKDLNFADQNFTGNIIWREGNISGSLESNLLDMNKLPFIIIPHDNNGAEQWHKFLVQIFPQIKLDLNFKEILYKNARFRNMVMLIDEKKDLYTATLDNLSDTGEGYFKGKTEINFAENSVALEFNAANFDIAPFISDLTKIKVSDTKTNGFMTVHYKMDSPNLYNGAFDFNMTNGQVASNELPLIFNNTLNASNKLKGILNFCLKTNIIVNSGVYNVQKFIMAGQNVKLFANGEYNQLTDSLNITADYASSNLPSSATITNNLDAPSINFDKTPPRANLFQYVKTNNKFNGAETCKEMENLLPPPAPPINAPTQP